MTKYGYKIETLEARGLTVGAVHHHPHVTPEGNRRENYRYVYIDDRPWASAALTGDIEDGDADWLWVWSKRDWVLLGSPDRVVG